MHFSIPDTQELNDNSGSTYIGYNIHINGTFHCTVRYRQLHNLNEQLKKEYGASNLPYFPPKKLLPLSSNQLGERRGLLEKYIQKVGQHPELATAELLNSFLLTAQQETNCEQGRECSLDIFLMNGYCITLSALTNDRSYRVLEKVCRQINLPDDYVYYFSLFLVKSEENEEFAIFRKLQDFESPYISHKSIQGSHRIVLRKSYWDPGYDLELMTDRVALNLLYVQAVAEVEHNWIICGDDTKKQLSSFQIKGNKRKYMDLARTLKFYGYVQFRPCVSDYPFPDAPVVVSIGNNELSLRVQTRSNAQNGDTPLHGNFKVTRMRCWRITTLHNTGENGNESGPQLELSFEYLVAKDRLTWITVSSEQAILMSICLQSMVDELLLKKNGCKRKMPGDNVRKLSWTYMKRDGSSQWMSSSQSSSSDGFTSSLSSGNSNHNTPVASNNGDLKSPVKSESSTSSMKRLSEKFSNVSLRQTSVKPAQLTTHAPSDPVVENDAFDGIGDDDL